MLELKNITKKYPAGNDVVEALRGVSLQFRRNEFVSILGPSGCGKTTLLNIIGGLDQYTSGDLIINGKATKDFKDRDWDAYRNHSIGFVFQNYNLIPHQTVLQNVELALTLSGVSKHERRKRAKSALEKVGLGSQLNKRPTQMSGGQMQRVAIARAIVNNPDIILADEPTGALDSETSIQVMDILQEIAKDRLVIMVTHNPDLAEKYSTRIVKILDGKIVSDSAPLTQNEVEEERKLEKAKVVTKKADRKPSMSLGTSFGLSLRNLISKKGRTVLTSFAGSIGIIGICLIYAVSQGTTSYIDQVQEETLSSYPLSIEDEPMDMSAILSSFMGNAQSTGDHEKDAVYQKNMVYDMINALNSTETTENDLQAFKKYLEDQLADETSSLYQAVNGVQYTYDLDMLVYTESIDGTILQADSETIMQDLMMEYFGMDVSSAMNIGESYGMDQFQSLAEMSPSSHGTKLFEEMLSGNHGELISPVLEGQYDLIYGTWPTAYDEVVLVLDENNELDDMTLYALGLKSKDEIDELAQAAINKTTVEVNEEKWNYEDICDRSFRIIFNSDCYTLDEATGLYVDLRDTQTGLKYLYDNGLELKITGIICPNEDAVSTMLSSPVGYTHDLTEYIIQHNKDANSITAQLEKPDVDIFTGLPFQSNTTNLTDEEKTMEFHTYLENLNAQEKAETYVAIKSLPSKTELDRAVAESVDGLSREDMENSIISAMEVQTSMSQDELSAYVQSMSDDEVTEMFRQIVEEQVKAQYAQQAQSQLAGLTVEQRTTALEAEASDYTVEQCAEYYDEVLEFSDSTYEDNLLTLGYLDLDAPASINLYASSFENKDVIVDTIADYNEDVDELSQINYTDYVGLMMSSVTTIINVITYVLIAFVAVSLIVSSIMIGVITLISVQERTKEIGILRAIGASKKNVSTLFNAETILIGLVSGLLGVVITDILCLPVNAILHHYTGIGNLNAFLPWQFAVIMVAISVLLTTLSGIIPSRSAAKKDPVVALRTE